MPERVGYGKGNKVKPAATAKRPKKSMKKGKRKR
jgi:hypothetical protein